MKLTVEPRVIDNEPVVMVSWGADKLFLTMDESAWLAAELNKLDTEYLKMVIEVGEPEDRPPTTEWNSQP